MKNPKSWPYTHHLRRFAAQDAGTATVDAVLWMPIFFALFALLADTALVFGDQARVLRVVQDTNRAISVGRIRTIEVAQQTILSQIASISPNAVAHTTIINGVINSSVVLPLADMTATHLVAAFDNLTLTVSAQHMAEN